MARLNRLGVAAVGGIAAVGLFVGWMASSFTVEQKEVAIVTHFGAFEKVAGAGLHFRNPFTESYELFHVSTQQLEVEHSEVYTADNQGVNVTMLVQYDVPEADAKNLFEHFPNYQQRMYSLANDRMKEAFGHRQVADIPSSRAAIEDEIRKKVSEDATRLYGLSVSEIQITELKYSETFLAAVDQMTKAKAEVTKAEQLRLQSQKDAERQQITAKANADAETVQAEADAKATRLRGEAEADAIKAKALALGSSPFYVQYQQARQWDGKLPQTILGTTALPIFKTN